MLLIRSLGTGSGKMTATEMAVLTLGYSLYEMERESVRVQDGRMLGVSRIVRSALDASGIGALERRNLNTLMSRFGGTCVTARVLPSITTERSPLRSEPSTINMAYSRRSASNLPVGVRGVYRYSVLGLFMYSDSTVNALTTLEHESMTGVSQRMFTSRPLVRTGEAISLPRIRNSDMAFSRGFPAMFVPSTVQDNINNSSYNEVIITPHLPKVPVYGLPRLSMLAKGVADTLDLLYPNMAVGPQLDKLMEDFNNLAPAFRAGRVER